MTSQENLNLLKWEYQLLMEKWVDLKKLNQTDWTIEARIKLLQSQIDLVTAPVVIHGSAETNIKGMGL